MADTKKKKTCTQTLLRAENMCHMVTSRYDQKIDRIESERRRSLTQLQQKHARLSREKFLSDLGGDWQKRDNLYKSEIHGTGSGVDFSMTPEYEKSTKIARKRKLEGLQQETSKTHDVVGMAIKQQNSSRNVSPMSGMSHVRVPSSQTNDFETSASPVLARARAPPITVTEPAQSLERRLSLFLTSDKWGKRLDKTASSPLDHATEPGKASIKEVRRGTK